MTVNTIGGQTAAAARGRRCPLCETPPGTPCQPKPAGDHLARYLDAYTAGQLTREYMAMVVGELVTVDPCTVVAAPAASLAALLGALLGDGHEVSFARDPEGVVAHISEYEGRVDGQPVIHTGIADTPLDALAAAAEGMAWYAAGAQ